MSTWIVMASVEPARSNGVSFDANAVALDEASARKEAARRNAVEREAGHVGVDWFPARDPIAMMAEKMGMTVGSLQASLA